MITERLVSTGSSSVKWLIKMSRISPKVKSRYPLAKEPMAKVIRAISKRKAKPQGFLGDRIKGRLGGFRGGPTKGFTGGLLRPASGLEGWPLVNKLGLLATRIL
jgi:hypothetical protein